MNMLTQPGRPYRRALNNLLFPLLAITLACTPAYSGTCDSAYTSVVNWLNQGSSHWVTAVVASNRAAALPGMKSEVTYSNIALKLWKEDSPDNLLLYIEGLDSTSHLFGHLFRARGLSGELHIARRGQQLCHGSGG